MATAKADKVDQIPVGDVPDAGKVVDERWFVEEYYPPRIDPITQIPVAEANSWIAKHQPDFEGGKFRKAHEELRETIVRNWVPA